MERRIFKDQGEKILSEQSVPQPRFILDNLKWPSASLRNEPTFETPCYRRHFHQALPLTGMVAVTSRSCTGGVITFSGNKVRITPLCVHRLPSALGLLLSTLWSTTGWRLNSGKCKITANSGELYYSPARYNVASIVLGPTAQNSNRAPAVPRVPSSGISNNCFRLLRVVRQQDSLLWCADYLFLRDT